MKWITNIIKTLAEQREAMINKEKKDSLRLFNQAVEYFDLEDEGNKEENVSSDNRNILRSQMLNELNNLRDLLLNNPDTKISELTGEERKQFESFLQNFSTCPICGSSNHLYNLKKLYFDDDAQYILDFLLEMMESRNTWVGNLRFQIGIPCCSCFKKYLTSK